MSDIVNQRYDFVYLFDCQDGNPNGDPDADNAPRFDPETFQGLVSDVCLKRKIRDYVALTQIAAGSVTPGYEIFVMSGNTLESRQRMPYDHLKLTPKEAKRDDIEKARAWMCQHFYDVRSFGAVMSTTDYNCGQVRGPVQITFARSLHRVFTTEHSITRVAFTTEKKKEERKGSTELGRKHTLAYALYRAHGFVNAAFSRQTGFNADDLAMLWKTLAGMWDVDRSAARGLVAPRGLYVFRHASPLGEAPAHLLFERVQIQAREGVETPRSFGDYSIRLSETPLPAGVELLTPMSASAGA